MQLRMYGYRFLAPNGVETVWLNIPARSLDQADKKMNQLYVTGYKLTGVFKLMKLKNIAGAEFEAKGNHWVWKDVT